MKITEFNWNENGNSGIVIYGTTVGGKIIFQCLRNLGIEVDYFCDRSGKYTEFCGVPVREPSVLNENRNSKVLIALTRSFNSACQYLESLGYEEVYTCCNLIENKNVNDFLFEENEKTAVTDFLQKYSLYANKMGSEEIILPTLEVFITERCTLRCRDCSHLIPRYNKPADHAIDEIISNLENVLKIVSKISDLAILGGEPLLHRNISQLLEYCYNQSKIEEITIISNGTVMPDENVFQMMRKTKTRLRLSNYGKHSIRINKIVQRCKEENITCYLNNELWTDMGEIYNHNYDQEELKTIFTDCPFSFSLLLLKGRIFRCAHVAHLNNLGVVDSYKHDSVDVRDISQENLSIKKSEMYEYMNISYLEGCSYCNGIKNSVQGIEPAIQGIR